MAAYVAVAEKPLSMIESIHFIRLVQNYLQSRFARNPDLWKSRQASKQSAYEEFYAAFGPKETKASQSDSFLVDTRYKSPKEKLKGVRKEIDTRLSNDIAPNSGSQFLAHLSSVKLKRSGNKQVPERAGFAKDVMDNGAFKGKNKKHKMENTSSATKNIKGGKFLPDDKPTTVVEKKRCMEDALSKSLQKKQKSGI